MKETLNSENKNTHLTFIQNNICRMANNSFSIKGWSVGIMIAIYAFAGKNSHKAVAITLIPLFIFWILDSYYLIHERKYRKLYDNVRLKQENDIDYSMDTNNLEIKIKDAKKFSVLKTMFSISVFPFYIACILATIIIYLIEF